MHGLELVAVGVAHEGGVVVGRVVAQARFPGVAAARDEGRSVESVDSLAAMKATCTPLPEDASPVSGSCAQNSGQSSPQAQPKSSLIVRR